MGNEFSIPESELRMYLDRAFMSGVEFDNKSKFKTAEEYARALSEWRISIANQLVNEARMQQELRRTGRL